MAKTGILLANLGTPQAPTPRAVRRYLREFLSDPRVIDIPAPLRWLLVNLVIAPFRPAKSARLYESIWRKGELYEDMTVADRRSVVAAGSPLLHHSSEQAMALQEALPDHRVILAMRYGQPSIRSALDAFHEEGIDDIVVLPLFPQYASATTGSVVAHVFRLLGKKHLLPRLRFLPEFHTDAGFVTAYAAVASPLLADFKPDHVVFSYHGLPARQVRAADPTHKTCLASPSCCERLSKDNRRCYRAQCFATTRALCARLALQHTSTAFQSRLGRNEWIGPATDSVIAELARSGVKRLAVICPAFVADCLETLEEIGLRGAETFRAAGGEDFLLVPSLNAHPRWIEALTFMVRRTPE